MLGVCEDRMDLVQDEMIRESGPAELPPTVVASPIYRGLVLSPNIEREGSQQWPNSKGDN